MTSENLKLKLKNIFGKRYKEIYIIYRIFKRFRFYVLGVISLFLLLFLNLRLKKRKEMIFVSYGWGVGDNVCLTGILFHLSKQYKIFLFTDKVDVYKNLKNIKIIKKKLPKIAIKLLGVSLLSNIVGIFEIPIYMNKRKIHLQEAILSHRPDIIKKLESLPLKPVIVFSPKEIKKFSKKYKDLLKIEYGIIHSGVYQGSLAPVKNLGRENFQKIVNKTNNKIKWVQVGLSKDPPLKGVYLDLRGKTTLRELFFLVSRSKLVVCTEGALTHISAAFDIPCVSIYSGYHYPNISLYKNVIPITPSPLPPCGYCWISPCPFFSYPKCLKKIKIEKIIESINSIIKQKRRNIKK